jgi:hypothetical protein
MLSLIRRNAPTCPTCSQPVIPPTPSKVVLARVAMTAGTLVAGLLEYRRAVKREAEQHALEQQLARDVDGPLDDHLAAAVPEESTGKEPVLEEPALGVHHHDDDVAGDGTDNA